MRSKGIGPQGLGAKKSPLQFGWASGPAGAGADAGGPGIEPFEEEFNRYLEAGQDGLNPDGTEKSSMVQGQALDEVVVGAGPREKTRTEHRLDKTQSKGEAAAEARNYRKANRLQRRKQRLQDKIARQDSKDKKTYVRKDKKYWRDQETQDTSINNQEQPEIMGDFL